jgi:hypothetical protein
LNFDVGGRNVLKCELLNFKIETAQPLQRLLERGVIVQADVEAVNEKIAQLN